MDVRAGLGFHCKNNHNFVLLNAMMAMRCSPEFLALKALMFKKQNWIIWATLVEGNILILKWTWSILDLNAEKHLSVIIFNVDPQV